MEQEIKGRFIPAEYLFWSSFSVSMPSGSDVQRANQLPNLVKRTIKTQDLTKVKVTHMSSSC